jgi:hypothetical protein
MCQGLPSCQQLYGKESTLIFAPEKDELTKDLIRLHNEERHNFFVFSNIVLGD